MYEIETDKIGTYVGRGGDFIVRKYGDSHVIKFSTLSRIIGEKYEKKMVYDYTICKQYLKTFIVDVIVADHPTQYIEFQEYISGETLKFRHFKNKNIRQQFVVIQQAIQTMQTDGIFPIDLVGYGVLSGTHFSNIIVDENEQLRIIDASLLEPFSWGFIGYLFFPIIRFVKKKQEKMLEKVMLYGARNDEK